MGGVPCDFRGCGMSKITTPATGHELQLSSAPDFNDVCDELYGCRTAFDGMIELMTVTNSDKIAVELVEQWLRTLSLRLNMCEKMLQRATDAHYGHMN